MKRALAGLVLLAALPAEAQQMRDRFECRVHRPPEGDRLATCTGRPHPREQGWTFVLIGRGPNRIQRIEIYELGVDQPRQVLDGFEGRPPLRDGDVGFALQDFTFDGYDDLRIALAPRPGQGTPFKWWQFDRESKSFVATDKLDDVLDPAIRPRKKRIIGAWRDAEGRPGRAVYRWRAGELAMVGGEVYDRKPDGTCRRIVFVEKDGELRVLRELDCRPGQGVDDEEDKEE